MRTNGLKHLFSFALLLGGGLWAVHAQNYTIDWQKIAGGGGTSTGGVYTVSGTIGPARRRRADDGRQLFAHRRFLEPAFCGPNPRRAPPLHQPFRQHGDGLLAERVGLEFEAEQR